MEGDKKGVWVHEWGRVFGRVEEGIFEKENWRKILEEFWASGLVTGILGSGVRKIQFPGARELERLCS
jgi:hypothetical protein